MWITRPATVDNYRQSLLAVCGSPVDGVGTSDALADRGSGETDKSSTSGHTLCKRFYLQQVLEHKALFAVIHRNYPPLSTTTICIHKEKGKPINRLASIYQRANTLTANQGIQRQRRCDGRLAMQAPMRGLRNPHATCGYKAHVPAPIACRYHVALGAIPRRLCCVFYLLLKGVKQ